MLNKQNNNTDLSTDLMWQPLTEVHRFIVVGWTTGVGQTEGPVLGGAWVLG